MSNEVFDLENQPLHLGLGATAIVQPHFTGDMDWYEAYGGRHGGDGVEGRLVTIHTFDGPWDHWEMHPLGDEVVVCLTGRITLHQEKDGDVRTVTLEPNAGRRQSPRRLAHGRRDRAGNGAVHHRRNGDPTPAAVR